MGPSDPGPRSRARGCLLLLSSILALLGALAAVGWLFLGLTGPGALPGEMPPEGRGGPGGAAWSDAGTCLLEIADIVHDEGTRFIVEGTARVPADAKVWVLAHGEETDEGFWPQLPSITPGGDGHFSAIVFLGGFHQKGHEYEVALVAVDARGDERLRELWRRGMRDDWAPIELPPGPCPPSVRRVHKPWF